MKRVAKGSCGGWVMLVLMLAATSSVLSAQAVTAVPKLDMSRFTGTWYEIARFPNKRQKRCVGDAFRLISPGDKPNQLLIVSSCKTKTGYPDVRNGSAKAQGKSGDGKLRLPAWWPFARKEWVLALGGEYEWALVGNPNHKELWVFSRTPRMAADVLREVEAKAGAEGFEVAKLVMTPQGSR